MNYLKTILLEVKFNSDVDRFFIATIDGGGGGGLSRQNFAENVLKLLETYGYEDLPNLILKSRMLREYSIDKLINILTEKLLIK